MKASFSLRLAVLAGMLILTLLTAAVPFPGRDASLATDAQGDLIRLTVVNRSSGFVYLWLKGPAFYYMSIKPETTGTFTIERGEYEKSVWACGDRVTDTESFTSHTLMIMPVCGGSAVKGVPETGVVDLSDMIRIVRVTIVNDAPTRLFTILTGPATYVFTFNVDEEQVYTIAKGTYKVQYWACGKYATKTWHAYDDSELKLKCPK